MTIMTPDHQVLDLASAASDERGASEQGQRQSAHGTPPLSNLHIAPRRSERRTLGRLRGASLAPNRRLRRVRRAGRGQVAVAQTVLATPAAAWRFRSGVGRAAGTRAGHLPPPGRLDPFNRLLSH